ncbi:hypothetical protein FOT71_24590, partial [Klebsiella pneumoniae]|nr:hypothetical protein [Klebsiella pneumoniae]
MGSCAAPSAKGDDKFITTDYLQQCLKKRHHSREKKRKQANSRQQTGKTRKGNAGGASARPG